MLYADEAYVNWLKSLKPGDEVACNYTWNEYFQLSRVQKVTATRRIKLENGLEFDSSGIQIGGKYSELVPATDQVRLAVARRKALRYLINFDYDSLPTEALLKILEVIKEHNNEDDNARL